MESRPSHLDPSELGTKEYWDEYYERDLNYDESPREDDLDGGKREADTEGEAEADDIPAPPDQESWFQDVGAPAKTLAFLTSTTFPLSPQYVSPTRNDPTDSTTGQEGAKVLDLGTGNGSTLFSLRLPGGYTGPMVGVDYSERSIELAKKAHSQWASASPSKLGTPTKKPDVQNIDFYVYDIITDSPQSQPWWPATKDGFDLVLDKGTFDAISLAADTVHNPETGREQRIFELYPSKVLELVKPGGFLLVTSCNWTEAEVVTWFTGAGRGPERFEVYGSIKYPVFVFGGQKGQGVASICFTKVVDERGGL